jgi:hypothetical protein
MNSRVIFAIFAIFTCLCLTVHAESMNITENITVSTISYGNVSPIISYIYQGDKVQLNSTIDISGVVPPYPALAYWDGYDMYDSVPTYNLSMPDRKIGYYNFWIDPEIFGNRTGKWYKYNGKFEPQGNNLAFVVSQNKYSNYTTRYPNGTLIEVSDIIQNATIEHKAIPEPPLLPERHESDYIVAKGDPVIWPDGGYRLWVFGRIDGIYDHRSNIISTKDVESLENGRYTVAVHTAGNNTIYEATYSNNTLYPAFYGKKPITTFGLNPALVLSNLKSMLQGSDDNLYEYNLEVDIPYITIRQADEVIKDGLDYMDVRGYTNVANGTEITVSLDDKYMKEFSGKSVAIRTSPGNLSYYRVYVPFDWDELAADARNHTLTARTAIGGWSEKDFKVSILPPDSYKPNASLKYIEDRNPFVPTPTPEIVIQKEMVIVTRTIEIPLTPSTEQIRSEAVKVVDEQNRRNDVLILIGVVVLWFLLFSGWFVYSMWRAKKR